MPDNPKGLLLDTHVWLWLMEGHSRLAPAVRETIQENVPDRRLHVAAISVWELAMLEAKGRIAFDVECGVWVRRALAAPGFVMIPLLPEISIASTRLPGEFHGDPADRLIVATARQCGCTLVTADQAILDYAASGNLRVLPAD